jgi:DNA-binding transcriptional ArsR family regulator
MTTHALIIAPETETAVRRDILLTLKSRGGGMTAGAIADRFACSWPSTTRHLRVLEDAGLMMERRGRERLYKLGTRRLLDVAGRWLERYDDRENLERPSSAKP